MISHGDFMVITRVTQNALQHASQNQVLKFRLRTKNPNHPGIADALAELWSRASDAEFDDVQTAHRVARENPRGALQATNMAFALSPEA